MPCFFVLNRGLLLSLFCLDGDHFVAGEWAGCSQEQPLSLRVVWDTPFLSRFSASLFHAPMKHFPFLYRFQIYMRNLEESPPNPALMTPPSRRALPFLNKGTLMRNCLSPLKGTVFQGHTKRKALSICLAQQTRLTRQLRNSPRCLPVSSV